MRNKFIDHLCKKGSVNKDLVVITADLGYGLFDEIFNKLNDRVINCGICEQLMTSMACGLSHIGKEVVTYSIGVFPTLRCLEQIRNDICYHNSNVLISTTGAGFSYGALGMSHHCTEDIGVTRSLPNLRIASPASEHEMNLVLNKWEKYSCPKYLRLDKSETIRTPKVFTSDQIILLYKKNNDNKKLLIIHGAIINIFDKFELSSTLFNNIDIITVPEVDFSQDLYNIINQYERIYILEEHNINSGFGSFIAIKLQENCLNIPIKFFGIKNHFSDIVGDQNYLRKENIGTASGILENIRVDY